MRKGFPGNVFLSREFPVSDRPLSVHRAEVLSPMCFRLPKQREHSSVFGFVCFDLVGI